MPRSSPTPCSSRTPAAPGSTPRRRRSDRARGSRLPRFPGRLYTARGPERDIPYQPEVSTRKWFDALVSHGSHQDMSTALPAAPSRFRGRLLLLLGLGLAVLGVAAYVVQISLQRLMVPWYMPALAVLGVVLIVMSLWERRTVWRVLALLTVVLLAGCRAGDVLRAATAPVHGADRCGTTFPCLRSQAGRRHAIHPARPGRRSEQRTRLLPRPVVTHLHDRAGSARTASR